LGKDKTTRNELYCKRLLEALRKYNSQRKTHTIEERDFYSGRLQQFVQAFFGKNEKKVKVLFEENGDVGNINSFVNAL
jgi:hypothetical protein